MENVYDKRKILKKNKKKRNYAQNQNSRLFFLLLFLSLSIVALQLTPGMLISFDCQNLDI